MSSGYTTLPPIFTTHQRPGSLSISHTARSRAAASSHSGGGGGSHTARGSSDRRGLKPPLPEFRKKKDLSSGNSAGGRGARDDIARDGATLIASNRNAGSGAIGTDGKRGRMGGPGGLGGGGGSGNHHHLVGASSSSGHSGVGGGIGGRSSSDEATISADGTVTFGPNLSLLMSSLAVRFDDAGEWEDAGSGTAGGGGGTSRNRRLGDDSDHITSSLALLSSRKRASAKKAEWSKMNALYAKAMEDKTTTKEQSQWFLARFNYSGNHHPIVHTPAPGVGAGLIPPQGMRQAVQQQHQQQHQHQNGYAAPLPEHAHLLHSASGSYLKNHHGHNTPAEQATSAAVRVEEEPEEYQDDQ
jgi:hypothetical protein